MSPSRARFKPSTYAWWWLPIPHRLRARLGAGAVGRVARARVERSREALDLLLGLVLRNSVDFLDPAREFLATDVDHVKVVIRELAPLLVDLALELLPVAFDAIPIHLLSP